MAGFKDRGFVFVNYLPWREIWTNPGDLLFIECTAMRNEARVTPSMLVKPVVSI